MRSNRSRICFRFLQYEMIAFRTVFFVFLFVMLGLKGPHRYLAFSNAYSQLRSTGDGNFVASEDMMQAYNKYWDTQSGPSSLNSKGVDEAWASHPRSSNTPWYAVDSNNVGHQASQLQPSFRQPVPMGVAPTAQRNAGPQGFSLPVISSAVVAQSANVMSPLPPMVAGAQEGYSVVLGENYHHHLEMLANLRSPVTLLSSTGEVLAQIVPPPMSTTTTPKPTPPVLLQIVPPAPLEVAEPTFKSAEQAGLSRGAAARAKKKGKGKKKKTRN